MPSSSSVRRRSRTVGAPASALRQRIVWLGPLVGIAALTVACGAPSAPPSEVAAPVAEAPPPRPDRGPVPEDLIVPADVLKVADLLIRAERQIRSPDLTDEEAGRWGHVQQRVYRTLAGDEVLARAVLGRLPAELVDPATRNLEGTRAIAKTVTRPQVDLPDWRIVEARPPGELKGYYQEAGAAYDVPWTVLASIHLNETRMGRLRGTSPAGARGPMQFMPATWELYGLGGDIESDRDAIFGAAHYVAKSGWATDRRKAIWAYNHSEAYIDAILSFAELMDGDALAYRGYWGWQVYYRTVVGSVWLAPGYEQAERVPIETWCAPRGEPYCPKVH